MERKLRLKVLIGVVVVAAVVIGVLSVPEPKEAMAFGSQFYVWIDWNGNDPDDDGIIPKIITRTTPAGGALDIKELEYMTTDEFGISLWKVAFVPHASAVVCEAVIENENPHQWLGNPILDGDDIDYDGNNELDNWFICVD